MDPEPGSNNNVMAGIDPGSNSDNTRTDSAPAPIVDDSGENVSPQTQDEHHEMTPPESVQAALDAFNSERNKPSIDKPLVKEEGSDEEPAPTETPTQAAAGQPQSGSRIFEGLDENESRMFRRMSNEAYNTLYPAYKEYKELKARVPKLEADLASLQGKTYFDHEEAYRLSPEFSLHTENLFRLDSENQYWQQQLTAVENGEQWQDIAQFDSKTGQYTLSNSIEASPQAKTYLLNKLAETHALRSQEQTKLAQFQGSFKSNYQGYVGELNKTRDKVLEGVDPATRKQLEEAAKTKLELWPMMVRNRPEVRIAAELLVVNEGLVKLLMEKEGQLQGRTIVNRTARNAGPVNVGGSGPAGNGKTVDAALNEFKQAGFRH